MSALRTRLSAIYDPGSMSIDYDRLRLLWPDHLGLARGKYLTPEKANEGTAHCISLFTLGFDREMRPHDGGLFWQGLPDCDARFDPDDIRPGWQDGTAVVIPEIVRGGEPVPLSPRNVLKEAIAAWESKGLTPKVGIELEAFLFEPTTAGDGDRPPPRGHTSTAPAPRSTRPAPSTKSCPPPLWQAFTSSPSTANTTTVNSSSPCATTTRSALHTTHSSSRSWPV
jgi:glutamine synthetase